MTLKTTLGPSAENLDPDHARAKNQTGDLRVRTGLRAGALNAYLKLKSQKQGEIKG